MWRYGTAYPRMYPGSMQAKAPQLLPAVGGVEHTDCGVDVGIGFIPNRVERLVQVEHHG
jgi:hypothetical protein